MNRTPITVDINRAINFVADVAGTKRSIKLKPIDGSYTKAAEQLPQETFEDKIFKVKVLGFLGA